MNRQDQISKLNKEWANNPRWEGVERPYTSEEVVSLRSSVNIEYTLAKSALKNSGVFYKVVNLYVHWVQSPVIRQFKRFKQD